MPNAVAVKRPCYRCTVTAEDILSSALAVERSVEDTKINRSRFMVIADNNTGRDEVGSEVGQEGKNECSQPLLRISSVPASPSFLKHLWNRAEYKE